MFGRIILSSIFLLMLSGQFTIHASVLGDINDDNKIDLAEAVNALQVASGSRLPTTLSIQQSIDNLPSDGGTVYIKAGMYNISASIHINKSNVTLQGEQGAILFLADHINQPVILIGTDVETPSAVNQINNIRLCNLEINGNKGNQDSEFAQGRAWLRNNGIDVRRADDVWIENVNIHDARSGGVVTSWDSDRIFIVNSSFHNNQYDGIALYDGQDIQISNFIIYENNSAGISLDNKLKNVCFTGGIIRNNGDVGIFSRDSEDINFKNLVIKNNGSHGCFISHQASGNNTGVKQLFFSGCSFLSNNGYGLWLASTTTDSPNNTVLSSLFIGNTNGCYQTAVGGELNLAGNICK